MHAYRGLGESLWETVKQRGVMSQRFCLHLGSRVLDIRQKSSPLLKTEPSCLINRYMSAHDSVVMCLYVCLCACVCARVCTVMTAYPYKYTLAYAWLIYTVDVLNPSKEARWFLSHTHAHILVHTHTHIQGGSVQCASPSSSREAREFTSSSHTYTHTNTHTHTHTHIQGGPVQWASPSSSRETREFTSSSTQI
jgi:hypothetical protein